jgi:hypothetical protein
MKHRLMQFQSIQLAQQTVIAAATCTASTMQLVVVTVQLRLLDCRKLYIGSLSATVFPF